MCFFTSCKKPVNERGKFCEYHDQKERQAAREMAAVFDKVEVKCEGSN